MWKTSLPASTQYFENLFYNGSRRLRPRLGANATNPLGVYYRVGNTVYLNAAPPPANPPDRELRRLYQRQQRLGVFRPVPIQSERSDCGHLEEPGSGNGQSVRTARRESRPSRVDIEVLIWEAIQHFKKLRVSCVDTANRIVYMTGRTGMSQANSSEEGFIQGNRYLVENLQDSLSQPGQWFLDRSAMPWTLTYLANTGENPNNDTVFIPQLTQLLVANNGQYVTFQGLTFEHDNYTLPFAGHISSELEPDISAAVSIQNSQHITFDSGTVRQTSGSGLEIIPCLNPSSPAYCGPTNLNAVMANNVVQNSAFYDIGAVGVRIGNPFQPADTDANVPQSTTVRNNVVEGYGRTVPSAFRHRPRDGSRQPVYAQRCS